MRKNFFRGLFIITLIWAVVVTFFCFYKNPLPFPDRGHRCFAVPNEKAAKITSEILAKIGGLHERLTFHVGSTHQTLLWDNTTVIIYHDNAQTNPNGLSVVVSNPKESALEAADMLRQAGFTANIFYDVMPELGDKFVLLDSNAFDRWVLLFRRHVLILGKPPNQRKISK